MAINKIVGAFAGANRFAMVVIHVSGEETYEEWRIQESPTGQMERDSMVSIPLSEMLQRGMSTDFAKSLPRYKNTEIPDDFWMPCGEITAQMYQVMSQEFRHPALAVTRRVNYWKARKFAHGIRAWYILDGAKGLLAQFPGMDKPNFYSWEEFAGAMNTYFPTRPQEKNEPVDDTSLNDFYFHDDSGNRLIQK